MIEKGGQPKIVLMGIYIINCLFVVTKRPTPCQKISGVLDRKTVNVWWYGKKKPACWLFIPWNIT